MYNLFLIHLQWLVVYSEGTQMHVDYISHTHNIIDSSENTGQSIKFLVMPNEKAIIMDVSLFKNILLQWIILESEVKSDKTVFVQ